MKSAEFEHLLDLPESELLDWKAAFPTGLDQPSKTEQHQAARGTLLKDLLALANTPGNAVRHLIYGVKDEYTQRRVIGVKFPLDDADLRDWVRNAIEPAIQFASENFQHEGKDIFVFTIYPSRERPHVATEDVGSKLCKGQVWYRDGTQNRVATASKLRQMFTDTGVSLEVAFGSLERHMNSATADVPAEQVSAFALLKSETYEKMDAEARLVESLWQVAGKPQTRNNQGSFALYGPTVGSMRLTDEEKTEIQTALFRLKIVLPWQALEAWLAFGDFLKTGWWMRSANSGEHMDWRNALEKLLWSAEYFNHKYQIIKDMHRVYRMTVAVRNTGEIPLEQMRLTLDLDPEFGLFEDNPEGLKDRPYPAAPEPPPDPRRFQVFSQTASVEHPLIPAGETEVFFGVSVRRCSLSVGEVPLRWRVASSSLRKPEQGTLSVQFQSGES